MTARPSNAPASTAPGAHMRAEIAEQPQRWSELLGGERDAIDTAASVIREQRPELLVFVARGSSDHAAMYGQYLVHNVLGIPAMLATPATVTAFNSTLRYPKAVAIAVSQSGESPDLLSTVTAISDTGVPVIAITNHAQSTLAGLGRVHVPLSAGPELSVAATKTYTAELLAIALIVLRASGLGWNELEQRVESAAQLAQRAIEASIDGLVRALDGVERVLVAGRGYSMATAKEGALKLMETNSIAASGWSAADATHGPLGQVIPGTTVVVLTTGQAGRDSVVDFARAANGLGGQVVEVGSGSVDEAQARFPLSTTDVAFAPLVEIIPLQRMALELALRRGLDPDSPAGLSKVTKTT
ncbi:SIS domain-containing protein [Leifsonia sp. NPDC056665]|uniref:SIS domain-containing protein n=1 Tax=Leifsonia sp. NPDC056665 TaxID=3345901 RepID=UPI0036A51FCD